MREEILWQKKTKSKKGIIRSQPRKKTKTTRARCRIKPTKRVDGMSLSTKFGDLITADHKCLSVENEWRCGHKNATIEQDDFTNWIQSYPMKTEDSSETVSC